MVGLGTLVNLATVTAGSLAGLAFAAKLKPSLRAVVINSVGLVTLVIGAKMALETEHLVVLLLAVLLGALTGTWLKLDEGLEHLAERLKKLSGSKSERFVEGFVTASILFCVGPLTVVGSLKDGLTGDSSLLLLKSTLDGFSSFALSAALGPGVIFSLLTILVVQGGLTAAGYFLAASVAPALITELTAAGGVLVLAIGLELLELKRLKPTNLLPALVYAPLLYKLALLMPFKP